MLEQLDHQLQLLRTELTRLVREGNDEDGLRLRRLLAELERLENQRLLLRSGFHGGTYADLAH
jgi:hypothetical protein